MAHVMLFSKVNFCKFTFSSLLLLLLLLLLKYVGSFVVTEGKIALEK
jgi:hypothetical protein